MPRIGLLTYHRVHNFGAVVQSWAMTRLLSRHGDVEVLDYPTLYETGRHRRRGWKALVPSIGRIRFNRFVARLPLTDHLPTPEEVSRQVGSGRYDALVCGSDQVWMTDDRRPLDAPFFLSVGEVPGLRRISYAPSCGPIRSFGPHGDAVRRALADFAAVSVRDDYSRDLLADLGIDVDMVVADPTLVADLSPLVGPRPRRRPYLAMVGSHGSADAELARRIAARRGLDVVAVGCRSRLADASCRFASPEEWVNHIAHADFVVTSLFHGTAVSIAFRRPFVAVPSAGRAFKIADLLDRIGLADRLVSGSERSSIDLDAVAELDWQEHGRPLEEWIRRSRRFLDDSFGAAARDAAMAEAA